MSASVYFADEFAQVVSDATHLRTQKMNDYGGSFYTLFAKYGFMYLLPRLEEKLARLASLTIADNAQQVMDESVRDTLNDIGIICLNAVAALPVKLAEVVALRPVGGPSVDETREACHMNVGECPWTGDSSVLCGDGPCVELVFSEPPADV